MKKFKPEEHYTKILRTNNVVLRLNHWSKGNQVNSIFVVSTDGIWDMQENITPKQARELAANLLEHADEVEAQIEQLAEKHGVHEEVAP